MNNLKLNALNFCFSTVREKPDFGSRGFSTSLELTFVV